MPYGADMSEAAIQERTSPEPKAACSKVVVDSSGDFKEVKIKDRECIEFNVSAYTKPGEYAYVYCIVTKDAKRPKGFKTGGGTIVIGG
jgi:hypothetical protein